MQDPSSTANNDTKGRAESEKKTEPNSFARTEAALDEALTYKSNRVIALTGKWGTGKTHLWNELRAKLSARNAGEKTPIAVSLFGTKTIGELKLRIVQKAWLSDKKAVKSAASSGGYIFQGLAQSFLGVDIASVTLAWLPRLIEGRLVVIDDVERKHQSLDIDEVMGFIDEYSQEYNVQFLLLLNDEKLADSPLWETLHEKVVDLEIVLDPSPDEAFFIAAKSYRGRFKAQLREAIVKLQIKNIRILRRIVSVIQAIENKGAIDHEFPGHAIAASTAVLTAIHYRAAGVDIPLNYVRRYRQSVDYFKPKEQRRPEELSWDERLSELGIQGADAYEDIVCEYLQTGLLNEDRLRALVGEYKAEVAEFAKQERIGQFGMAYLWDPEITREQLAATAKEFVQLTSTLRPWEITEILKTTEALGLSDTATELLASWSTEADKRVEFRQLKDDSFEYSSKEIHPRVMEKLVALRQRYAPRISPNNALLRIRENSGWGAAERRAFKESSQSDYEVQLHELRGESLGKFVNEHLTWVKRGVPDPEFQRGADNFLAACKSICVSNPQHRLTQIIKMAYERRGLADRLGV